ncbi:MAG: N-acetylneuraminate synthase [Bacteroidota bacterium]
MINKTLIIAEAGVNHNGSIDLAKKLIDIAVDAGADVVKFQTFKADKIASKIAQKADYQKENISNKDETQYEMIKKLELDFDAHKILIDYCKIKGIIFLSTPFDLDSIDLLVTLEMETFKIPSGEITNLPYLMKVAKLNKKVIMSTGMSSLGDIEKALDILTHNGTDKNNIVLLHANTEYPTPIKDVNLKSMVTIGNAFNVKYGYSDHTNGIEVAIAAVALGASVIEKHFTLDKTMEGPDHKASLEPLELKIMVQSIRNIELALGDGIKHASESESKNINIARKSIVAAKKIEIGELFTEENLTTKRPGNGMSPMKWFELLGTKASKSYNEDELI